MTSQHHPPQPASEPSASAAPHTEEQPVADSVGSVDSARAERSTPTRAQIKRWRKYLADEIAEAALYSKLAHRKTGVEREILKGLAEAEKRHQQHWRDLLGDHAAHLPWPSTHRLLLGWLAKIFGSVFVLALAQRAERRSPYGNSPEATREMAADEEIHEEIIRALATQGRERLSGGFRAAVFGANDGLVSNLALIIGMAGTGVGSTVVVLTGVAGLLSGALSMAAGEFVSVRSQRELLDATRPTEATVRAAPDLDFDHNELVLVYRARGLSAQEAEHRALERLGAFDCDCLPQSSAASHSDDDDSGGGVVGSAYTAALSSFALFGSGAFIPLIPYLLGFAQPLAMILACALVGLALLGTGAIVGLLSGASPWKRALRQLGIGLGAAGVTYLLGSLMGVHVG